MASLFDEIKKSFDANEVEKFNPHHDAKGRFSTGPNAVSFTTRTRDPKKQHWADRAKDRESVRVGVLGTGKRMVGTEIKGKDGHNVHQPKRKGGKLIGNAVKQRGKLKRADAKGEKYESARERKNRLSRERRAEKKKNLPKKGGAKVYQMPNGNKRPPRKTA